MSIQMTAKKSCRYGTRQLTAGEDFEVPGQSMKRLYEAKGWAAQKVPEPRRAYATRAELPPATDAYVAVGSSRFSDGEIQTDESLADNDPGLVGSVDEPRQKRKYTRRDLTAE